ncbi:uncharacterized protein LOC132611990 [Lycium barbarum]|uniref:uncharacterized protein LOC132611990 n=1 Tax=Lycium barbarum TaxID=112863 RepID=UPI00293F2667|nr:uncharacterized protein LOC132611990 [Lycium barbarum]
MAPFEVKIFMAQSRQKSKADQKVLDLEFMVGEQVLLKRIGEVASELVLPLGVSSVYPVFHVSMLKKYHFNGSQVISWDLVLLDQTLTFEEELIAILYRQVQKLTSKEMASVEISSSWGDYLGDRV